jgi:CheY-like chemotaxis protein
MVEDGMTTSNGEAVHPLLVVDEPGDVEFAQRALQRAQICGAFSVVGDGALAVEILSRQSMSDQEEVVLLLLDLGSAKVDGRKVLRRVWNDQHLRHVPVIVPTGSSKATGTLAQRRVRAVFFLCNDAHIDRVLDTASALPRCRLLVAVIPEGS